jgi:hypothetical protein
VSDLKAARLALVEISALSAQFAKMVRDRRHAKLPPISDFELDAAAFFKTHGPTILRALEQREGWQPIESAPRDGMPILVCRYEGGVVWWICASKYHKPVGFYGLHGDAIGTPTHWQPLPAAPNPEGSTE